MDPYIGMIILSGFDYNTQEYHLCDGTIMQVVQNQALFALIGNKYGGDGRTTFALPNMKGMEPTPGMEYYIAIYGLFPSRA
jgi:microcystin-dependent protein